MHGLSEIKTSQRNNPYFNLKLQAQDKTYRTMCFSPEKHGKCKANFESSSPVKITKFQIKRNNGTKEDEIHMNTRTRLEDPEEKVVFDIQKQQNENVVETMSTVSFILQCETNTVVSTSGRITFQGPEETLQTKGKTLRKQEAILTDNTGTMRLVLWESDIEKVKSGCSYELKKLPVRRFQENKYITLNMRSTINSTDEVIERTDDVVEECELNSVDCPAEGVQSLKRYLSCNKCHTKIVPMTGKNIVKCSECGLVQLKTKCKERLFATVLFMKATTKITLVLFDDKLKKLCSIHEEQSGTSVDFAALTDDDIMEMILTVQAKIFYNAKQNVLSITK